MEIEVSDKESQVLRNVIDVIERLSLLQRPVVLKERFLETSTVA